MFHTHFVWAPGWGGKVRSLYQLLRQMQRDDMLTDMRTAIIRTFESGATRDSDNGKYDYEGFLSPAVLERFAEYMHKCRIQSDGNLRDSDNWQKGIPQDQYMKSAWRHFHAWWKGHRNGTVSQDDLCAMMFNVMGYLHENLKEAKNGN